MSTTPPSGGGPPLTPWSHILTVVITAIIVIATAIVVSPGEPTRENPKPKSKVTVTLGGQGNKKITLDTKAQRVVAEQKAELAAGNPVQSESDLHDSMAPPKGAQEKANELRPHGQPVVPVRVPEAAPTTPGCTSVFVRNQSPRQGAPILFGFIHWTGSAITIGPQAGLATVRWFDTAAAQASATDITDQTGRCWYTVPETAKPWTQANANRWSLSVEIVNPGVLPLFRTKAARDAVIRLMIGWHHRWKLPYQHGIIRQGPNNSCVPVRPGFLAHRDGGRCAGNHPDVGLPSVIDSLIAEAKRRDTSQALTAIQQHACDVLNWHRRRAHVVGRWFPKRAADAARWKKLIPAGRCPSKYRKA